MNQADKAYPWLLQFLPIGLKGVAFAALAAAIVSSLASMLNSTSTIFTMDIYKQYINKNAKDKTIVRVGRITAIIALILAAIMAPLLGGIDQAFQFIQEYTGLVSPGILAVFIMGLFWKKATNNAAIWGALLSIPTALFLKSKMGLNLFPFMKPWMHQMGMTALFTIVIIVIISYLENKGTDDSKGINLTKNLFKTSPLFNIASFVVLTILAVLYTLFW
jgi:SSS family solute:Na+ symporter